MYVYFLYCLYKSIVSSLITSFRFLKHHLKSRSMVDFHDCIDPSKPSSLFLELFSDASSKLTKKVIFFFIYSIQIYYFYFFNLYFLFCFFYFELIILSKKHLKKF